MVEWTTVADGLRFPEGPVAMPDGSVLLVEIEEGRITRVRADGTTEIVAEPGGGPNGLAIGPDGKLYCCNNGGFDYHEHGGLLIPGGQPTDYSGGRIERIDLGTGAVEVLYRDGDFGCSLRGPNDIVFDRDGGFWFTDFGKTRERERDRTGVFHARVDGSALREAIFPLENPNGIGLSPDCGTLYTAETFTRRLMAFDVTGPGQVGPGRGLYRPAGEKWFDSLGVEACGNICVATIGECGINVISPTGELVEFAATDDPFTTNICWGGEDMRDAYVTCSGTGRLLKTRWPRPGLRLAY